MPRRPMICALLTTSVPRIGKSRPGRRLQVPSAGVYLGWLPGIAINASSAVKRVTPVRKIAVMVISTSPLILVALPGGQLSSVR
jgi:hypothetical protein